MKRVLLILAIALLVVAAYDGAVLTWAMFTGHTDLLDKAGLEVIVLVTVAEIVLNRRKKLP